MVPLSSMFGYLSTLRSMTQGSAQCMMAFSHYEQVPPNRGPDDDNFPPAIGMRAWRWSSAVRAPWRRESLTRLGVRSGRICCRLGWPSRTVEAVGKSEKRR